MTDGDDQRQWDSIARIEAAVHGLTSEMRERLARIETGIELHVANHTLHHIPPCDPHRALSAKLWAIIMLCLGSIAVAVRQLFV